MAVSPQPNREYIVYFWDVPDSQYTDSRRFETEQAARTFRQEQKAKGMETDMYVRFYLETWRRLV